MKRQSILLIFLLTSATGTAWAYGGGGGGSSKSCEKPKFFDYSPAENAQVSPGADFSFTASKNTYPTTIKVKVKEHSVAVKTEQKADGTFDVSGKLPASVKGAYARIGISADAQANCKGTGGWLVKISE